MYRCTCVSLSVEILSLRLEWSSAPEGGKREQEPEAFVEKELEVSRSSSTLDGAACVNLLLDDKELLDDKSSGTLSI